MEAVQGGSGVVKWYCSLCRCPMTCLVGEARSLCARCLIAARAQSKKPPSASAKTIARRVRDRKRYMKNHEDRLAKAKDYYQANKDAILDKRHKSERKEAGGAP